MLGQLVSAASNTSGASSAALGSITSSYATLAGVLAGFSLTALAVYLGWRPESVCGSQQPEGDIAGPKVVASLFYAMASLAMCSFLYASVASPMFDVGRRASAELLLYGIIFGLSVLALFYSLTLMAYENVRTREAARYAYWVVVIAGPIVILRFLMDAANNTFQAMCLPRCIVPSWSPPVIAEVVLLGLLLVFSAAITVLRVLHWWTSTQKIVEGLYRHPALPSVIVFVLSTCVTVGSLLVTAEINFSPSSLYAEVILCAGFALLALFALACGCVVGPRVQIGLPEWLQKLLGRLNLNGLWKALEQRAKWMPEAETVMSNGRHVREAPSGNIPVPNPDHRPR